MTLLIYYYLWQFALALYLKRNEKSYDVVHNLNFHNNWTPTFLWLLKKPLVWGPVAFHPKILKAYTKYFSKSNRIKNKVTWWIKKLFWTLDPFLKISKNKAFKVIAPNDEAFDLLGVEKNKRVRLFSVASEEHNEQLPEPPKDEFKVLSVGRFVDLKGFDIAVKSFHKFWRELASHHQKTTRLIIVGKGPQLGLLEEYIKGHELESCITIIDWIKREDLKEHYRASSCFLFCSHEGAGMVVPEAMSYGNPVLCFDNIGPGLMINKNCGIAVPYTNYEQSLNDFSQGLHSIFSDRKKLESFSLAAQKRFKEELTWNKKGEVLKEIYEQAS